MTTAERLAVERVREALQTAEQDFRRRRSVKGLLLTSEINWIRERVSRRLGVTLPPLQRPLHEGLYGGRERDPEWPAYIESAFRGVCLKYLGAAPFTLDDYEKIGIMPPRSMFIEAEDIAAASMRATEREATRSLAGRRRVA